MLPSTNTNLGVTQTRLSFADADAIQISSDDVYEYFSLLPGQTRTISGNFYIISSVATANEVISMSIWAGFVQL